MRESNETNNTIKQGARGYVQVKASACLIQADQLRRRRKAVYDPNKQHQNEQTLVTK
jgi:hypothetical protein